MIDFKEWNHIIRKLTYNHNKFEVFKDYLNIMVDNFTIPDQEPEFKQHNKYTEEEHKYFTELFIEHMKIMQKELDRRDYCDFLGEWWEADANLTNKDTEQYFTPSDICSVMSELTLINEEENTKGTCVMHDCCCGSGRFALAHHSKRPQDWVFLVDIDEVAVKMCLVNMLFHGVRGVVAWGNAITQEVFKCWCVTPSLFEWGGMPYLVPHGKDIKYALSFMPHECVVWDAADVTDAATVEGSASTVDVKVVEDTKENSSDNSSGSSKKSGNSLDKWLS